MIQRREALDNSARGNYVVITRFEGTGLYSRGTDVLLKLNWQLHLSQERDMFSMISSLTKKYTRCIVQLLVAAYHAFLAAFCTSNSQLASLD